MEQEKTFVPVIVSDGGAGLAIGAQVREEIVRAERLSCSHGSNATSNVQLFGDNVFPDSVDGLHILLIARKSRHVGHSAIKIAGTDSMTDRFFLIGRFDVRLVVLV